MKTVEVLSFLLNRRRGERCEQLKQIGVMGQSYDISVEEFWVEVLEARNYIEQR